MYALVYNDYDYITILGVFNDLTLLKKENYTNQQLKQTKIVKFEINDLNNNIDYDSEGETLLEFFERELIDE